MSGIADEHELLARANAGDHRAQYLLAAALARTGNRSDADRWLKRAADNDSADAQYTLATRHLMSLRTAPQAIEQLEQARRNGSADAVRLLAALRAAGIGVACDEARGLSDVIDAAKSGDAAALREIACLLALADKDHVEIMPLIVAAGAKDPVAAAFALARSGAGRDAGPAAFIDECAATLSAMRYPRAEELIRNARRRPSTSTVKINWSAVTPGLDFAPVGPPTRLSDEPDIVLHRGIAPSEVCEYLIAHAAPRLGPSLVYNPQSGGMIRDPLRTSATASLGPMDLDLPLIALNRLLSAAANCAVENGEFLSVLYYTPGQQYRPHLDCIPPGEDHDRSGQRIRTGLLFLNTEYVGGETHFLVPDLKIRGSVGDLIVFSNVDASGAPDRSARHAGLAVASGAKWLASKWFRAKNFEF